VFVDNYLDGGYHVPHLHKGLNSVLDYKQYTIENEDRYCLQSSPMVISDEDAATEARGAGIGPGISGCIPILCLIAMKLSGYEPGDSGG